MLVGMCREVLLDCQLTISVRASNLGGAFEVQPIFGPLLDVESGVRFFKFQSFLEALNHIIQR